MNSKNIIEKIYRLLAPSKERDIEHYQVIQKIYSILDETYPSSWIAYDMVDNDGNSYIVFTSEDKLYRAYYEYDGEDVNLSDPSEVEITIDDVQASRMRLVRAKDENLYFIGIAASTVLNRIAAIDSRALFDDFENEFEKRDTPIMSFYHRTDYDGLTWGDVVSVSRFGNLLMVVGKVDEDTLIGKNIEVINERAVIGFSIGFVPTDVPTIVNVDDVPIKVYERGYLAEISLLLEEHAASYFTELLNFEERAIMARGKTELKKLLEDILGEGSEKEIDEALEVAEERNRSIDDRNMITRENEDDEEEQVKELKDDGEIEIVVDEAIEEIVEEKVEQIKSEYIKYTGELKQSLEDIIRMFEAVEGKIDRGFYDINHRVGRLEQEDDEKIREQVDDLPPARRNTTKLVYRKTEQPKEFVLTVPNQRFNLRGIAKETLEGNNE